MYEQTSLPMNEVIFSFDVQGKRSAIGEKDFSFAAQNVKVEFGLFLHAGLKPATNSSLLNWRVG